MKKVVKFQSPAASGTNLNQEKRKGPSDKDRPSNEKVPFSSPGRAILIRKGHSVALNKEASAKKSCATPLRPKQKAVVHRDTPLIGHRRNKAPPLTKDSKLQPQLEKGRRGPPLQYPTPVQVNVQSKIITPRLLRYFNEQVATCSTEESLIDRLLDDEWENVADDESGVFPDQEDAVMKLQLPSYDRNGRSPHVEHQNAAQGSRAKEGMPRFPKQTLPLVTFISVQQDAVLATLQRLKDNVRECEGKLIVLNGIQESIKAGLTAYAGITSSLKPVLDIIGRLEQDFANLENTLSLKDKASSKQMKSDLAAASERGKTAQTEAETALAHSEATKLKLQVLKDSIAQLEQERRDTLAEIQEWHDWQVSGGKIFADLPNSPHPPK